MPRSDTGLPPVSHDRLLGGRVLFDQPVEGYRSAIDPVLLAAAVPAKAGETVLELGSGAGAASLCLAVRVPGCRITGVEQDATLVALANANACANNVADRVRFVVGDIAAAQPDIDTGGFDHVMANPPFLEAARADLRGVDLRDSGARNAGDARWRAATIEGEATLDVWLRRMCGAARRKGRVVLIHRADRLGDIMAGLTGKAGDITILPLWPKAGQPARRIIVTARPGTATPQRLLAGLVLHGTNGTYSAAATAILDEAAALDL